MYAKVFAQIFDSSIAADYVTRHVFMDLLVLADRDGVVDMTPDAISRRTNVPEDIIIHALKELMKEDKKSRSDTEGGRRIVLLDSHRDWGWQIVNYDHYRQVRDEESRRVYFRDQKRAYRNARKTESCPHLSTPVQDSQTLSTKGEGDADSPPTVEKERDPARSAKTPSFPPATDAFPSGTSNTNTAYLIAKAVVEGTGITNHWAATELTKQAELLLNQSPGDVDGIRGAMIGAWKDYLACAKAGKLKTTPMAAQKFYGDGIWKQSSMWGLKKGATVERDSNGT